MSPHDAVVHGAFLSDQEEKITLQGADRVVIGIANNVAVSSLRALASECWTKFPCNKPGVLEQSRSAQTERRQGKPINTPSARHQRLPMQNRH